jgi:hypothetical protein
VGAYRRAGTLPAGAKQSPFEVSPEEALPLSSSRAESFLQIILNGDYGEVLAEYLEGVSASGRRVSEAFLPALLDIGRRRSEIRPLLLSAGGERLRWLGGLNPDWSYANVGQSGLTDDELAQVWQTGSRSARLSILSELRLRDAVRGRDLVESTWKQEASADRASFIASLATGLSMDDEPFLESALADRSVEVGRSAADVLARLSESRYAQRMAVRAQAAVCFVKEDSQEWRIAVTLPERLDDGLKADRVEEKSANRLLGERAWLLCQIVGAAPLAIWEGGHMPAIPELIKCAEKSEWANALITGWSIALKRHPDRIWLAELARHWLGRAEKTAQVLEYLPPLELFPDVAEALILEFLANGGQPLFDKHPAFVLLSVYRLKWSVELSRAVLQSLYNRLAVTGGSGSDLYQLHSSIGQFALRIPAELADEASNLLTPNAAAGIAGWNATIDRLLQTLHFRNDMLIAIGQQNT